MDAPAPYTTAGLVNLISGVLNVLTGLATIMFLVGIIPLAIGGWQIMVGLKMKNGEKDDNAKNSVIAGLVASVLFCNPLAIACAGYAFMQLGQDEVVGWLEG